MFMVARLSTVRFGNLIDCRYQRYLYKVLCHKRQVDDDDEITDEGNISNSFK